MKILIATNHLNSYGGTETYTYALIEELIKKKHDVEYFTFKKGLCSDLIEKKLKVCFMSSISYDVIFANHVTCIELLRLKFGEKVLIVQTCHGIFPELEQPSLYANYHISVSKEVFDYLKSKKINSEIILNGINCERFKSKKPLNEKIKTLLSLCQSEEANSFIKSVCDDLKIEFKFLNKHKNKTWHVEKEINESDIVVGLGRSAYEALACGRPVIVYDNRSYFPSYADGYLDSENIDISIEKNCSGRSLKKEFLKNDLKEEIKKYQKSDKDFCRYFATKNLNIETQAERYISIISNSNFTPIDFYRKKILDKILNEIDKKNDHYISFFNYSEIFDELEKNDSNINNFKILSKSLRRLKKNLDEEKAKSIYLFSLKNENDRIIKENEKKIFEDGIEKAEILENSNKLSNEKEKLKSEKSTIQERLEICKNELVYEKAIIKRIKKTLTYKTLVKLEFFIRRIKKPKRKNLK